MDERPAVSTGPLPGQDLDLRAGAPEGGHLERMWASSRARQLCGRAGVPPLPPPVDLVPALVQAAHRLTTAAGRLGAPVAVDPLALLGERMDSHGVRRRGQVSPGGFARLHRCADGWMGLSMARQADADLLPAWLGVDPGAIRGLEVDHESDRARLWALVDERVSSRSRVEVVGVGAELGLPVAGLGEETDRRAVVASRLGSSAPLSSLEGVRVVDLSALWAGPLCTRILADAGADVVKVESVARPDGARRGPAVFFERMHSGKRAVALDFGTERDREALVALVSWADVVVEASRPRALAGLGLEPAAVLDDPSTATRAWLSITGHGRSGPGANRVAFGDDAAVAGGAVAGDGDGPCFAGDALADPVAGLFGAVAVLEALAHGDRWLLDLALSRAAACVAGAGPWPRSGPADGEEFPVMGAPASFSAGGGHEPVARHRAPALGQHTDEVLAEVGLG